MAALSEWLQIMLAEIARKREDLERAHAEDVKRDTERDDDAAVRGAQQRASRNQTTR
jgi:activator of HSP90 ATPase